MKHKVLLQLFLAVSVGDGEMRYYSFDCSVETNAFKSYAWTFKSFWRGFICWSSFRLFLLGWQIVEVNWSFNCWCLFNSDNINGRQLCYGWDTWDCIVWHHQAQRRPEKDGVFPHWQSKHAIPDDFLVVLNIMNTCSTGKHCWNLLQEPL